VARTLCIVNFHGVGPPPRALDPGEDEVWMSAERFREALDVIAQAEDVEITFDDGNDSDVAVALPELRTRGLRATFFVVVERIGRPGFLSWDGVHALAAAGMSIGSHGARHVPWRRLDGAGLDEELAGSRRAIEEALGSEVHEAAVPFGAYDRRVLSAARRAGYERVLTSDGGRARRGAWLQPRTSLGPAHDADAVRRVLAGESAPRRGLRVAKRAVKRIR
jgi:peptidoglycan/xylan/chitin deacetylase (PgdA/CDA1 family)